MRFPFLKTSATLTLFFFATTLPGPQTAWAAAGPLVSEISLPSSFQITIPEKFGTVDTLEPGGPSAGATIVHIQEAHGLYEGQKNIEAILNDLNKAYGIDLVLTEGSSYRLHPELLRYYPQNQSLNDKVLEKLLESGLLSGPETFLARHPKAQAYGIEDLDLYTANGRTFKAVHEAKDAAQAFLSDLDIQIERFSSAYLSSELRTFLKRLERFERHEISLMDWITELQSQAKKLLDMDLESPVSQVERPMLVRIFTLKNLETKFDRSAYLKERTQFLTAVRFLPKNLLEKIKAVLTDSLSQNRLPAPETGRLFEEMASRLPVNFPFARYPNVNRLIGHAILLSELESAPLMEEMKALEGEIIQKLAPDEKSRAVTAQLADYRMLQKLFRLELTPAEYEQIQQLADSGQRIADRNKEGSKISTLNAKRYTLEPSSIVRRLETLNSDHRVKNVSFEHIADLNRLFDTALAFYKGAQDRDQAMLKAVEKRLKETGKTKAVVITGGFHQMPFENHFKAEHANYALVTPKLGTVPGEADKNYIEKILKYSLEPRKPEAATYKDVLYGATLATETLNLGRNPFIPAAMTAAAIYDLRAASGVPAGQIAGEIADMPYFQQFTGNIGVTPGANKTVHVQFDAAHQGPSIQVSLADNAVTTGQPLSEELIVKSEELMGSHGRSELRKILAHLELEKGSVLPAVKAWYEVSLTSGGQRHPSNAALSTLDWGIVPITFPQGTEAVIAEIGERLGISSLQDFEPQSAVLMKPQQTSAGNAQLAGLLFKPFGRSATKGRLFVNFTLTSAQFDAFNTVWIAAEGKRGKMTSVPLMAEIHPGANNGDLEIELLRSEVRVAKGERNKASHGRSVKIDNRDVTVGAYTTEIHLNTLEGSTRPYILRRVIKILGLSPPRGNRELHVEFSNESGRNIRYSFDRETYGRIYDTTLSFDYGSGFSVVGTPRVTLPKRSRVAQVADWTTSGGHQSGIRQDLEGRFRGLEHLIFARRSEVRGDKSAGFNAFAAARKPLLWLSIFGLPFLGIFASYAVRVGQEQRLVEFSKDTHPQTSKIIRKQDQLKAGDVILWPWSTKYVVTLVKGEKVSLHQLNAQGFPMSDFSTILPGVITTVPRKELNGWYLLKRSEVRGLANPRIGELQPGRTMAKLYSDLAAQGKPIGVTPDAIFAQVKQLTRETRKQVDLKVTLPFFRNFLEKTLTVKELSEGNRKILQTALDLLNANGLTLDNIDRVLRRQPDPEEQRQWVLQQEPRAKSILTESGLLDRLAIKNLDYYTHVRSYHEENALLAPFFRAFLVLSAIVYQSDDAAQMKEGLNLYRAIQQSGAVDSLRLVEQYVAGIGKIEDVLPTTVIDADQWDVEKVRAMIKIPTVGADRRYGYGPDAAPRRTGLRIFPQSVDVVNAAIQQEMESGKPASVDMVLEVLDRLSPEQIKGLGGSSAEVLLSTLGQLLRETRDYSPQARDIMVANVVAAYADQNEETLLFRKLATLTRGGGEFYEYSGIYVLPLPRTYQELAAYLEAESAQLKRIIASNASATRELEELDLWKDLLTKLQALSAKAGQGEQMIRVDDETGDAIFRLITNKKLGNKQPVTGEIAHDTGTFTYVANGAPAELTWQAADGQTVYGAMRFAYEFSSRKVISSGDWRGMIARGQIPPGRVFPLQTKMTEAAPASGFGSPFRSEVRSSPEPFVMSKAEKRFNLVAAGLMWTVSLYQVLSLVSHGQVFPQQPSLQEIILNVYSVVFALTTPALMMLLTNRDILIHLPPVPAQDMNSSARSEVRSTPDGRSGQVRAKKEESFVQATARVEATVLAHAEKLVADKGGRSAELASYAWISSPDLWPEYMGRLGLGDLWLGAKGFIAWGLSSGGAFDQAFDQIVIPRLKELRKKENYKRNIGKDLETFFRSYSAKGKKTAEQFILDFYRRRPLQFWNLFARLLFIPQVNLRIMDQFEALFNRRGDRDVGLAGSAREAIGNQVQALHILAVVHAAFENWKSRSAGGRSEVREKPSEGLKVKSEKSLEPNVRLLAGVTAAALTAGFGLMWWMVGLAPAMGVTAVLTLGSVLFGKWFIREMRKASGLVPVKVAAARRSEIRVQGFGMTPGLLTESFVKVVPEIAKTERVGQEGRDTLRLFEVYDVTPNKAAVQTFLERIQDPKYGIYLVTADQIRKWKTEKVRILIGVDAQGQPEWVEASIANNAAPLLDETVVDLTEQQALVDQVTTDTIRISSSGLARIVFNLEGQDYYLLALNKDARSTGKYKLAPLGGAVGNISPAGTSFLTQELGVDINGFEGVEKAVKKAKAKAQDAGKILGDDEIKVIQSKAERDLRFTLSKDKLSAYIRWFLAQKDREVSTVRELGDELVKEQKILTWPEWTWLSGQFAFDVYDTPDALYQDLRAEYAAAEGEEQAKRLDRAYQLASEKHNGVFRDDGRPYIFHPLEIAYFLVLGLGITEPATILAALMHDLTEDTDVALDAIRKEFGDGTANIISDLTENATLRASEGRLTAKLEHLDRVKRSPRWQSRVLKVVDRMQNLLTNESRKNTRWRSMELPEVDRWMSFLTNSDIPHRLVDQITPLLDHERQILAALRSEVRGTSSEKLIVNSEKSKPVSSSTLHSSLLTLNSPARSEARRGIEILKDILWGALILSVPFGEVYFLTPLWETFAKSHPKSVVTIMGPLMIIIGAVVSTILWRALLISLFGSKTKVSAPSPGGTQHSEMSHGVAFYEELLRTPLTVTLADGKTVDLPQGIYSLKPERVLIQRKQDEHGGHYLFAPIRFNGMLDGARMAVELPQDTDLSLAKAAVQAWKDAMHQKNKKGELGSLKGIGGSTMQASRQPLLLDLSVQDVGPVLAAASSPSAGRSEVRRRPDAVSDAASAYRNALVIFEPLNVDLHPELNLSSPAASKAEQKVWRKVAKTRKELARRLYQSGITDEAKLIQAMNESLFPDPRVRLTVDVSSDEYDEIAETARQVIEAATRARRPAGRSSQKKPAGKNRSEVRMFEVSDWKPKPAKDLQLAQPLPARFTVSPKFLQMQADAFLRPDEVSHSILFSVSGAKKDHYAELGIRHVFLASKPDAFGLYYSVERPRQIADGYAQLPFSNEDVEDVLYEQASEKNGNKTTVMMQVKPKALGAAFAEIKKFFEKARPYFEGLPFDVKFDENSKSVIIDMPEYRFALTSDSVQRGQVPLQSSEGPGPIAAQPAVPAPVPAPAPAEQPLAVSLAAEGTDLFLNGKKLTVDAYFQGRPIVLAHTLNEMLGLPLQRFRAAGDHKVMGAERLQVRLLTGSQVHTASLNLKDSLLEELKRAAGEQAGRVALEPNEHISIGGQVIADRQPDLFALALNNTFDAGLGIGRPDFHAEASDGSHVRLFYGGQSEVLNVTDAASIAAQLKKVLTGAGIQVTDSKEAPSAARSEVRTEEPYYSIVKSERFNVTAILGSVTNTLKDMMNGRYGLSSKENYIFVLPPSLFDGNRSIGEMEFQIYFNAFVLGNIFKPHGRRVQIVGTQAQIAALRELLQHTIFGPNWESGEYQDILKPEQIDFFKKVRDHYAVRSKDGKVLPLDSYIETVPFEDEPHGEGILALVPVRDAEGQIEGYLRIDEIKEAGEVQLSSESFETTAFKVFNVDRAGVKEEDSIGTLQVNYHMPQPRKYPIPDHAKEEIGKAKGGFARTWLGTSTGFDPAGDTTSMILWLEGTGVWVDPSHEALQYMEELGIGETDVPYILLTHIHQDHDGGVLERILMGNRVKMIASQVVFEEFVKKAERLLKFLDREIDSRRVRQLVEWIPLDPKKKKFHMPLPSGREAVFESFWNIHPIPTNGFSVMYDGFKYTHGGDTQWSEEFLDKLVTKGTLTKQQALEQKYRHWTRSGRPKFDFMDHEAGGGLIHTGPKDLAALSYTVRTRMAVYHVPDAQVKDFDLHKAHPSETVVFVPSDTERQEKFMMSLLASNALLKDKTPDWLEVFRKLSKKQTYPVGRELTVQGHRIQSLAFNGLAALSVEGPADTDEDQMYFIVQGKVQVIKDGKVVATLGPGQQFGEWSFATGEPRSATIKVSEPLVAYTLTAGAYHKLFDDELTQTKIKWVKDNLTLLDQWTKDTTYRSFQDLSDFALVVLAGEAEVRRYGSGETIMQEGQKGDTFHIIRSGKVQVLQNLGSAEPKEVAQLGRGQHLGEIALLKDVPRTATARALSETQTLVIHRALFEKFLEHYPFIRISLDHDMEKRLRELTAKYFDQEPLKSWLAAHIPPRVLLTHLAERFGWEGTLLIARETLVNTETLLRETHVTSINEILGFGIGQVKSGKAQPRLFRDTKSLFDISAGELDVLFLIEPKELVEENVRALRAALSQNGVIYLSSDDTKIFQLFSLNGFQITKLVGDVYEITSKERSARSEVRDKAKTTAVRVSAGQKLINQLTAEEGFKQVAADPKLGVVLVRTASGKGWKNRENGSTINYAALLIWPVTGQLEDIPVRSTDIFVLINPKARNEEDAITGMVLAKRKTDKKSKGPKAVKVEIESLGRRAPGEDEDRHEGHGSLLLDAALHFYRTQMKILTAVLDATDDSDEFYSEHYLPARGIKVDEDVRSDQTTGVGWSRQTDIVFTIALSKIKFPNPAIFKSISAVNRSEVRSFTPEEYRQRVVPFIGALQKTLQLFEPGAKRTSFIAPRISHHIANLMQQFLGIMNVNGPVALRSKAQEDVGLSGRDVTTLTKAEWKTLISRWIELLESENPEQAQKAAVLPAESGISREFQTTLPLFRDQLESHPLLGRRNSGAVFWYRNQTSLVAQVNEDGDRISLTFTLPLDNGYSLVLGLSEMEDEDQNFIMLLKGEAEAAKELLPNGAFAGGRLSAESVNPFQIELRVRGIPENVLQAIQQAGFDLSNLELPGLDTTVKIETVRSEIRKQTTDGRRQITDSRLQIADSRLQIADKTSVPGNPQTRKPVNSLTREPANISAVVEQVLTPAVVTVTRTHREFVISTEIQQKYGDVVAEAVVRRLIPQDEDSAAAAEARVLNLKPEIEKLIASQAALTALFDPVQAPDAGTRLFDQRLEGLSAPSELMAVLIYLAKHPKTQYTLYAAASRDQLADYGAKLAAYTQSSLGFELSALKNFTIEATPYHHQLPSQIGSRLSVHQDPTAVVSADRLLLGRIPGMANLVRTHVTDSADDALMHNSILLILASNIDEALKLALMKREILEGKNLLKSQAAQQIVQALKALQAAAVAA